MNNQGVNALYIRTCGTVQQTVVFGASHDGAENCGFEVSIAPPSASSVFFGGGIRLTKKTNYPEYCPAREYRFRELYCGQFL
jgi:hypothetical protein